MQAIGVVGVSWAGAAYVQEGADWVGAKRVTRRRDGVTVVWCVVLDKVTWHGRQGK